MRTGARLALATLLVALPLTGCGGDAEPEPDGDAAPATAPAGTTESTEPTEPSAGAETGDATTETPTPAVRLPRARSVKELGGETITAEPFADFAGAAAGGIWVSGVDPGLVRYDAATGRLTHRVPLSSSVGQALDVAGGSVWVAGANPSVLIRVDERSGEVVSRTRLSASPLAESSPAVDGTTAYVLVDPLKPRFAVVRPGRRVSRLPAPDGALAARFADGWLWVTTSTGTLEQVDPETGEVVESVPVGAGARFLTHGFGAVWVMNAADGTVSRVSTRDLRVETATVASAPISGGDIAVGEGAVWVRTSAGATRLDPQSMEATGLVELEWGSGSIAAASGWVWLTDHDHLAVHRVPLPLGAG